MHVVRNHLKAMWPAGGVGDEPSVGFVALFQCPAIVDPDDLVTRVAEPPRDHRIGGVLDEALAQAVVRVLLACRTAEDVVDFLEATDINRDSFIDYKEFMDELSAKERHKSQTSGIEEEGVPAVVGGAATVPGGDSGQKAFRPESWDCVDQRLATCERSSDDHGGVATQPS